MDKIQQNWIKQMASLKLSIMTIANNKTSSNPKQTFQSSIDEFENFVDTYKGAIRNYPLAEDLIVSYNAFANMDYSDINNVQKITNNLLNKLDSAINKSNEEVKRQGEKVQNIKIDGKEHNIQIGNNNQIIVNAMKELENIINNSKESDEKKEEAISLLNRFLEHPILSAIIKGSVSLL